VVQRIGVYPYTSLKYHTLLVAALVSNYEAGGTFEDLALVVNAPTTVVPHRTILSVDAFSLRLTMEGTVIRVAGSAVG